MIDQEKTAKPPLPLWIQHIAEEHAGESRQVLLVVGEGLARSPARIYAIEKVHLKWELVLPPIDGIAGRKGFAQPEGKREGDGRTPTGVYPLEFAFGYAREISTKMAYRQTSEEDVWVDDVDSPDYNRWVKRRETEAASFEQMRRKDNLYRYGIVIGYNREPVIKGYGSAIFFHVWKGPEEPTEGCIAMSEGNLVAILGWLDPSQKPAVVIGTTQTLN